MKAQWESYVDETLDRLSEPNKPLPYSFTRRELFRSAAIVGIPVWDEETKNQLETCVLDRLGYEWDDTLERFVPVIGDELTSLIHAAAETITPVLRKGSSNLQSRIDDWCDEHGFHRLDNPVEIIARHAVFYCLVKATVYERYYRDDELPEFSVNIRQAFQLAGEQTGSPAFDECVLDEVAALADESTLEPVLEQRHRLVASEYPSEDIGGLFEAITPKESRQKLGQFRTPRDIAFLMRTWATTGGTSVLDPGMGACALSAPSFASWESSSDPPQMTGIDRSQLGIALGTAVMTIHGKSRDIRKDDFLTLDPDELDDDYTVVMNPPYSRSEELSTEYTDTIHQTVEQETGLNLSKNAPLYIHFIAHATQFLAEDGRAAFITPNYLDKDYGEALKEYLLAEYDIKALLLFNPGEVSVFDEAVTTGLITFVERREDNKGEGDTRFIQVDEMPETGDLLSAVKGGVEDEAEWGSVTTIDQAALGPEQNWRTVFDPIDVDTEQLTTLGEIATVNRGILTGKNDVFCVSQSTVEAHELDKSHLSRLVRKGSHVPHFDMVVEDWEQHRDADKEVWLLYHLDDIDVPSKAGDYASAVTAPPSETALGSDAAQDNGVQRLLSYLEHSLHQSVSLPNRTFQDRGDSWFIVDLRDPPPILVTTVNRDRCRFILNEADARNVNSLHSMYLDVTLTDPEIKALLAYLNSDIVSDVLREHERLHADGMRKLEPNDAEDIPILDPRNLPAHTVDALSEAFDTLCETARRDEALTDVFEEIDEIVQQEL